MCGTLTRPAPLPQMETNRIRSADLAVACQNGSHLAVSGSCPQSLPNMVMRLYQKGSTHVHTSFRRSCAPGNTHEMATADRIPVVDFQRYREGGGKDDPIVKALHEAFTTVGFVFLTNAGVDPILVGINYKGHAPSISMRF